MLLLPAPELVAAAALFGCAAAAEVDA